MSHARYVGLTMPDVPDMVLPVDEESTSVLSLVTGTVIHQMQMAELERLNFLNSQCWTDQITDALPWEITDFVNHLRYHKSMAEHIVAQLDALPQEFQNAAPKFHHATALGSLKTFKQVRLQIYSMADDLNEGIQEFVEATRPSGLGTLTAVPAITLWELRCWFQINTKTNRAPFEDPKLTEPAVKCLLEGFKPILFPDNSLLTEKYDGNDNVLHFDFSQGRKLAASKGRKIGALIPMVWYICSGLGFKDGIPFVAHGTFTIGATREQISYWMSAFDLRNDARNGHVGAADQAKWSEAKSRLVDFDTGLETLQVNQVQGRKHLLHHILNIPGGPNLGSRVTALADQASPQALRDVRSHVGLAFSFNDAKAIGCCYICKTTCRYAECGLAEDLEKAVGLNLSSRDTAWSCAEVLCSWYCENAEAWEKDQQRSKAGTGGPSGTTRGRKI